MVRSPKPGWALLALTGGLGCSVLLVTDHTQCASDVDCVGQGLVAGTCVEHVCQVVSAPQVDSGSDPVWGCLPSSFTPTPAEVTGRVFDGNDPALVVSGLTISVCSVIDIDCASPLNKDPIVTDGSGIATVKTIANTNVFWLATHPDYYPSAIFFRGVSSGGIALGGYAKDTLFIMYKKAAVEGLLLFAPSPPGVDPSKATVLATITPCDRSQVAGISFDLVPRGPDTTSFYPQGGFPSPTLTATDSQSLNTGGFWNVPPGQTRLLAYHDGKLIGETSAPIVKDRLNWFWLQLENAPKSPTP